MKLLESFYSNSKPNLRFGDWNWKLSIIFWAFAAPFIISGYVKNTTLPLAILWFLMYAIPCTLIGLLLIFYIVPYTLERRQYFLLCTYIFAVLIIHYLLLRYFQIYILKFSYKPLTVSRLLWGGAGVGEGYGFYIMLLMGRQFVINQQRLLKSEKEKKENELQMLRAQVDPHFLFNSLNTLNILIDINPAEARQFTERLANLYRQLLQLKDQDLVPLSAELKFADDYIYLLKKRYGAAYDFKINKNGVDTEGVFLPPSALQLLIENAVKHNIGDPEKPIIVILNIDNQKITIENNKRPKETNDSTGIGLNNLKMRYELLTDKQILVSDTEGVFRVELPLVKMI
jgi:two-component system, LytTR family, sensor kinase